MAITGGTNGAAWYDFGSKTGITSFTLNDPTGTNGTVVGAVEIDGALLVDGGFGDNGFYLPFDPAQTGANYGIDAIYDGLDDGPQYSYGDVRNYVLIGEYQMPLALLALNLSWLMT